ncbi:MAG: hypothetical protein ABEK50_12655 [bacterium]
MKTVKPLQLDTDNLPANDPSNNSSLTGSPTPYSSHRQLTITEIEQIQQRAEETFVVYGNANPVVKKTA